MRSALGEEAEKGEEIPDLLPPAFGKNVSGLSNAEMIEQIPLVPAIAMNPDQKNLLQVEKEKWLQN